MRRIALLAITTMLSGCAGSGFWDYIGDTATLPGANPNAAKPDSQGAAESYQRVRMHHLSQLPPPTPMLTEAGDVWPGPPPPQKTMSDILHQQSQEMNAPGGLPQSPLPSVGGIVITPPPSPPASPNPAFLGGMARLPNGRQVPVGGTGSYNELRNPSGAARGNIIVPNGDGTSTVISPNGQVTTIPSARPPAPPPLGDPSAGH